MGEDSPLCGTDLCPAVTNPAGQHKVETADIMRWVGKQLGLAPSSEEDDARAADLTAVAQEILNECFYPCLKPAVVGRVLQKENLSLLGCIAGTKPPVVALEALPRKLAQLEEVLGGAAAGGSESAYLLGEKLTYADAAVFSTLRETLMLGCFGSAADVLTEHPRLLAWLERMEALAAPWFGKRAAEHQLGAETCVEYLAVTNTPFPWRRRRKR
eukprot:g4904.t1